MTAVFLITLAISFLPIYVWLALAYSSLLKKAGEPGWIGWVPVYSSMVLAKASGAKPLIGLIYAGSNWIATLLLIFPFVAIFNYIDEVLVLGGYFATADEALLVAVQANVIFFMLAFLFTILSFVFRIILIIKVDAALGKNGAGWAIFGILLFPIWISVLAWGSARFLSRGYQSYAPATAPQPSFPGAGFPGAPIPGAPQAPAPYPGNAAPQRPAFGPPAPAPAPANAAPQRPSFGPPAPTNAAPAAPVPPAPPAPPQANPAQPAFNAPQSAPPAAPGPFNSAAGAVPPPPAPPAPPANYPSVNAPAPAAPAAPVPPVPPVPSQSAPPAPPAPAAPVPPQFPNQEANPVNPWAQAPSAPQANNEQPAVAPAVPEEPVAPSITPSLEDLDDRTVMVSSRKQQRWDLTLPDGSVIELTADEVVLGRNPVADSALAQTLAIVDHTRTISKTHAVLKRIANEWFISDLGSTNGIFIEVDGLDARELSEDEAITGSFLLGDAKLELRPRD